MLQWKEIQGYNSRYFISSNGQIKNKYGKILKPWIRNGYYTIGLMVNKKRTNYYVHRLVAEYFLSNPDKQRNFVNHLDGDKLNNNVSNLEWCTRQENAQHAYETGLLVPTVENLVRFDRKPVIRIEDGKWFSGVTEAANQMGVCEAAMSKCLNKGLSATCCGYHWKFA